MRTGNGIGHDIDPQSGPLADATNRRVRNSRHVLVVLAVYLLLTIVLTYPLPSHLTTHIPGSNADEGGFLWNAWWVRHSLLDHHTNPFYTDFLFYPIGMSTLLYTMAWLNCFLGLPFTLVSGPILGTNIPTLLAFVLSALSAYLLARDRLSRSGYGGRAAILASFIAGIIYSFVSARFMFTALGEGNFVSIQWLPLAMLYFLRTLERPGWRSPLLAALFALFAAWTELNYVVYLIIFAIMVSVFAVRTRAVSLSRATWARLTVALLVFTVGFSPLGVPVIVDSMTSGASLVQGWGYADMLVNDLVGLFVPSTLHPVFGAWAREAASRFTDRHFAFVGYTVLVLCLVGIVMAHRQRSNGQAPGRGLGGRAVWVVVLGVFFLFSLGPLLHINGQWNFDLDGLIVNVPLPYIIIHYLPFFNGSRAPSRFGIVATLAAGLLIAFVCHELLRRTARPVWQLGVTILVSGLIIFENMAVPIPLNNAVPPPPYDIIAQDTDDFAILQVPLGWRDGWHLIGPERTLLQAYQMVHEKPIVAGNGSRVPVSTFDYFIRAPIITSILNYEEGRVEDPAIIAADRARAASVLSFLNVRYIVVHGDYVDGLVDEYIRDVLPVDLIAKGEGREQSSWWRGSGLGVWVETTTTNASWALYKVRPNPDGPPRHIDLGTNSAYLHQVSGWSYDETVAGSSACWVDGKQAAVLIRLDEPTAATMSLRVAPFSYPGAPPQQMTMAINGRLVGNVQLQDGWAEYRMDVPAQYLHRGMNTIRLTFAHSASPADVLGTSDRRRLAAAVDWIRLD